MLRRFLLSVVVFTVITSASGSLTLAQAKTNISIIYAPESAAYLPNIITQFNALACNQGVDPSNPSVKLPAPICMTDITNGKGASSGTTATQIVNVVTGQPDPNFTPPTIFQPSVRHWLALANFRAGPQSKCLSGAAPCELFDINQARPTTASPVVIAIWQSRLDAIQKKTGKAINQIGWSDLLAILQSPNGWQDYGLPRKSVFYGHTDPLVSSTALSTLIMEYFYSANQHGFTGTVLTEQAVSNTDVQAGVHAIENLIKHYAPITTDWQAQIAAGTNYVDFVALEENDVIAINRCTVDNVCPNGLKPAPELLVALNPKEGVFIQERPMAIPNAAWVSQAQSNAANVFVDYVQSQPVQKQIMDAGFRPWDTSIPLNKFFSTGSGPNYAPNAYGVILDPSDVKNKIPLIEPPTGKVLDKLQSVWGLLRKEASIILMIDISGSMAAQQEVNGQKGTLSKLAIAIKAAKDFIEALPPSTRVSLWTISSTVTEVVPLAPLKDNKTTLLLKINGLQAYGQTALYEGVVKAVQSLSRVKAEAGEQGASGTCAIIILSDGQNSESRFTQADAESFISNGSDSRTPILVFTIAFGADADKSVLDLFTKLSNAAASAFDATDVNALLAILTKLSKYF